jgi:hypothetical protein
MSVMQKRIVAGIIILLSFLALLIFLIGGVEMLKQVVGIIVFAIVVAIIIVAINS